MLLKCRFQEEVIAVFELFVELSSDFNILVWNFLRTRPFFEGVNLFLKAIR
jgi:hypothetical protein